MSQPPTPKPRSRGRTLLIILGALFLVCAAITAVTSLFSDPNPDPAAQAESTAIAPAATDQEPAAPTDEPATEPTNPPPPADPEQALRQAIDDALGESNRDLGRKLNLYDVRADEGSLSVGWAADDNFSTDLIVSGMKLDTVEVLKAIDASGIPYEWVFIGSTFAMQDQFGNPDEMEVLTLAYQKATIDRINWDNFTFSNVFDIADTFVLHPAFAAE